MLNLSKDVKIRGAKCWSAPVNQLYRPLSKFDQETQDIVYLFDPFTIKKFSPIVLKESFYLVKKGGYLVIDYLSANEYDWKLLEKEMWWLWKQKYEIIFHNEIKEKDLTNLDELLLKKAIKEKYYTRNTSFPKSTISCYLRFIAKKKESALLPQDSINKWTFGIITNGDRHDWVMQMIASIKEQKIPHYEIIVCGEFKRLKEPNFTYIPFSMRKEKGWITKKKNIIAGAAKFSNLCIMHDRLILDPAWYKEMKKFGNTFDAIGCRQILENGVRAGDWTTTNGFYNEKTKIYQRYRIELLDYRDWDYWSYLSGQMTIIKKHVWKKVPWNEALYWGQGEDVDLSLRLQKSGHIVRFNPYSVIKAVTWRHGRLPGKKFAYGNNVFTGLSFRKCVRTIMYYTGRFPFVEKIIVSFWPRICRSRWYRYYSYH